MCVVRKTGHAGKQAAIGEKRPAFLLQGPLMLGIMLLGVVVYIGVMTAFTGIIQGSIVESLTDVPTMHEYDDEGARMSGEVPVANEAAVEALLAERDERMEEMRELQAGSGSGGSGGEPDVAVPDVSSGSYEEIQAANKRVYDINAELRDLGWVDREATIIHLYNYFAVSATILLVIMMMFSAAGHFMERGFGVWGRGRAAGMFRGAVIGLIVIWLLPQVWDFFALGMEEFALDTMRMGGDEPQQVIDGLWCKLGATAPCMFNFADVLDPLGWATALTSPSDFGMTLMGKVLLPFFKLVPALTITLTMFVIGEIRVLFISLMLTIMPLLVILKHLPYVSGHANQLINSLVGASIAPFFSALTLVVGWEYLSNATALNSLEEWVQALGIVALAGAWPVMLSPILSSLGSQVAGSVNAAVMSSAMMASQMGTGMAAGAMTAAQQGQGAGGMLAGAAMGGGASMIGAMPSGAGGMESTARGLGLETGDLITPPGAAQAPQGFGIGPAAGAGAAAGMAGAMPTDAGAGVPGGPAGAGAPGAVADAGAGPAMPSGGFDSSAFNSAVGNISNTFNDDGGWSVGSGQRDSGLDR